VYNFKKKKKNKHNAVGKWVDGIYFRSTAEAEYYGLLQVKESLGQISQLTIPKAIEYLPSFKWKIDFTYVENGELIYCEFKGQEMPDYKLKKALWKKFGLGKLRIIKKKGKDFTQTEEIVPENYQILKPCGTQWVSPALSSKSPE